MLRNYLKLTFFLSVLLLLVGCATTQINAPANAKKLQGIFGVVHNHQAESGRFIWVQMADDSFVLELYGPLGLGATALTRNAAEVTLTTANGKIYKADSPEALLEKVLGWSMPISGMSSWLWAKPVSGIPFTAQYDYGYHLTQLHQEGWKIIYTWQRGQVRKIVMTQNHVRITVVVNQEVN